MKKKHILILIILIAPFIAMAQFKVDLSLSPGFDKIHINKDETGFEMKSGVSFRGGVDAIYMFNSNISIGSGLFYSYFKSDSKSGAVRSSNALSIPLNILYQFSSIPIEVLLGTIANFNLNKQLGLSPMNFEEYNPLYMNLELGGFYYINKKFKLGIIADVGLTPYYEFTILSPPPGYKTPTKEHFIRNLGIKLNYTLFGKQ